MDYNQLRELYPIAEADGCWVWQGRIHGKGYGLVMHEGKEWLAHRLMYTLLRGPIPKGLVIDHICRNHPCVNPGHLRVLTSRANTLCGESVPAQNARKTLCKQGHVLEGNNVIWRKDGRRRCRECTRAAKRKNLTIAR